MRPDADSNGPGSRTDYMAGKVISVDGTRMIPVSRIRVSAGGTDTGHAAGYGGAARTEIVGVFLVTPEGREKWLPAESSPPDEAADWNAWLHGQPRLLAEIRNLLKSSP